MRSRLAVVLSLAVAALLLVAPTPLVGAASAKTCHPPSYVEKYRIKSSFTNPQLIHAKTIVLSPGGSYQKSTTLTREGRLTASVEYSSSATIEAGKVIAKASATVGYKLRAEGSVAWRKSTNEVFDIKNNTNKTRKYVLFDGVTKANGRYASSRCDGKTYKVVWRSGAWKSYYAEVAGHVACYKKAPVGVARVAKNKFCGA